MITKFFLLPVAAALALWSASALAQHMGHGHSHMGHGQAANAGAGGHAHGGTATAIAEGTVEGGVRVFDVAVTENGFEPSRLKVNQGEKVRLVVIRRTDSTCAKEIVIKDHGIEQQLPLNKAVAVEFTPRKSGEIRYACGMDHVSGVAFVR